MIIVARLCERNPKKGHGMRTYTTSATGTKFVAGEAGQPSALRVVADIRELDELRSIDQFQVLEFRDRDHLSATLQTEMEARARMGQPAIRAAVISETGEIAEPSAAAKTAQPDRSLDEVAPEDKTAKAPDEDVKRDAKDEVQDEDLGEDEDDDLAADDSDNAEEESQSKVQNAKSGRKPKGGGKKASASKGKKKAGKGRKAKK